MMTIQLPISRTTHRHVCLPVVAYLVVHLQTGLLIVAMAVYPADVQKIGEDQASRIPFRLAAGVRNLSEGWKMLMRLEGPARIATRPVSLPLAGGRHKILLVAQRIANVNVIMHGDQAELSALVGQATVQALLILPRAPRPQVP